MVLSNTPGRKFLSTLSSRYSKPRAAVVISAHFETSDAGVVTDPAPQTIYDFGNFDQRLFGIKYPAPGHPKLADEVFNLISDAGISVSKVAKRGFDHGIWVPLSLVWPEADVPIVQLSIDPEQGPNYHYHIGRALRSLPKQNIAVIGTGNISHNLPVLLSSGRNQQRDAEFKRRVQNFLEWFDAEIDANNVDNLLSYRDRAPFSSDNHPTDDHLLPLYAAMGAAGDKFKGTKIHQSFDFGVLAMNASEFAPATST
ncbi:4,5-DOPA dioxygenase extradiol [Gracilariopsis chorda]|uniref:4,5-DOPA dioxygenase extradiol n=1 Tax=Gracilariopsis chorda TaxID=448386 RepID=A0A2V3IV22_9FLOR|nr:4,5-DOPA dioxygenase extradiol [Gracilariopsis chorda]|eukprot:PXF45974.1 4,5-DOPA dioxygenase extradiol [Gracilariopsis chorda]